MFIIRGIAALAVCLFPMIAAAQGLEVAFGTQDQDLPVEVTAESLSVNQSDGSAVFKGDVVIVQGDLRISAPEVNVFYSNGGEGISRLLAVGGVLMAQKQDAVESEQAEYDVNGGIIELTGNVMLTQGQNTLTSDRMTVNLKDNTAEMHGRVKTILRTGEDN